MTRAAAPHLARIEVEAKTLEEVRGAVGAGRTSSFWTT
jgi:nicotinate-nucleotide pyrophosphorylase